MQQKKREEINKKNEEIRLKNKAKFPKKEKPKHILQFTVGNQGQLRLKGYPKEYKVKSSRDQIEKEKQLGLEIFRLKKEMNMMPLNSERLLPFQ